MNAISSLQRERIARLEFCNKTLAGYLDELLRRYPDIHKECRKHTPEGVSVSAKQMADIIESAVLAKASAT